LLISVQAMRIGPSIAPSRAGGRGPAVVQEREEPLEERVGLRGRLVTHGAHGSGEGRPCAMLAHAQTTP